MQLMDPSLNETEVISDFMTGWYGQAGSQVVYAYMAAFYQSAIQTDTYLRVDVGAHGAGQVPMCNGKQCPRANNPGKAICANTPVDTCTSGCPPGGNLCNGTKPPPGHSCNE